MNDALRGFKKATDQVRIRFDARQLLADDVRHLLDQATPLEQGIWGYVAARYNLVLFPLQRRLIARGPSVREPDQL
jgi:hypothetical protein